MILPLPPPLPPPACYPPSFLDGRSQISFQGSSGGWGPFSRKTKEKATFPSGLSGLLVVLFPRWEVVRLETTNGSRLLRRSEGGWADVAGGTRRPLRWVEEEGGGAMTQMQREQLLDTRRKGSRTPRERGGGGDMHHFNRGIFSSWQKTGGGGGRLRTFPFLVVKAALGDKNLCS